MLHEIIEKIKQISKMKNKIKKFLFQRSLILAFKSHDQQSIITNSQRRLIYPTLTRIEAKQLRFLISSRGV